MGVYRFEDLRVWQAAKEQCDRVGELIRRPTFRIDGGLSSQMNDASISVMNNIAEGLLFICIERRLTTCYCAAEGRKYIEASERLSS